MSNLYDYSDEYIHVKASIKVQDTVVTANRKVMLKDCALFINFINRINNAQVDDP